MDDAVLRELRATNDPAEKAAIIAEVVLNGLPREVSMIARRCVILHWFDRSVVEALLQDISDTERNPGEVYEQLASLPFIETLVWGLTFQDLTREGLLKRYALTQPKLLKAAARLAASAYEARREDEKIAAEALFCYIVAGDHIPSVALLNKLLEQASSHKDWQRIGNLLQLQEEAERLPFADPLLPTEQYRMLRGLVHTAQGKLEPAITDSSKGIIINVKNALAYFRRGITYVGTVVDGSNGSKHRPWLRWVILIFILTLIAVAIIIGALYSKNPLLSILPIFISVIIIVIVISANSRIRF